MTVVGDASGASIAVHVGDTHIELSNNAKGALQDALFRFLPLPRSNLPPDAVHFTGHKREAAALLAAVEGGGGAQAITALKGIGGIGKSALAVRVARQLALAYLAAQILVDLRGTQPDPVTPMAAMEDIIRRFGSGAQLPDNADAVGEIYRNLLGQHKALLSLDNSQDGAAAYACANSGVYMLRLRLQPRAWIDWWDSAAAGARQFGNRNGEGMALVNLGIAFVGLGETAKAIEYYDRELVIAREIGDLSAEGIGLNNTGVVYEELGRIEEARAVWTAEDVRELLAGLDACSSNETLERQRARR